VCVHRRLQATFRPPARFVARGALEPHTRKHAALHSRLLELAEHVHTIREGWIWL